MRKGHRELLKQLPGWEVAPTKGNHIRLVHKETRAVVTISSTPSDFRGQRNVLSDCRRVLREKGHD